MGVTESDALVGGRQERAYLTNLAFRMLGSWTDAEDAVQQTYERWYRLNDADRLAIARPRAWLTTAASRICLNMLDSARMRREQYVGEWLPEPVPTGAAAGSVPGADPLDLITVDDTVSMALLVVLESLTPAERVALVLHDVFEMPFGQIAEIVGRSPEAARQLASSARRHIRDQRSEPPDPQVHARLVAAFRDACQHGDLDALIAVLDPAVVLRSDGGGRVRSALRPIHGADNVARFLLGILRKAEPGTTVAEHRVNGEPGFAVMHADRVVGVVALAPGGDRIRHVWITLNPDKLNAWNRR